MPSRVDLDRGGSRFLPDLAESKKEITVKGIHFIQEDSPHEIGRAIADFARSVWDGTFAGD